MFVEQVITNLDSMERMKLEKKNFMGFVQLFKYVTLSNSTTSIVSCLNDLHKGRH